MSSSREAQLHLETELTGMQLPMVKLRAKQVPFPIFPLWSRALVLSHSTIRFSRVRVSLRESSPSTENSVPAASEYCSRCAVLLDQSLGVVNSVNGGTTVVPPTQAQATVQVATDGTPTELADAAVPAAPEGAPTEAATAAA